MPTIPGYDEAVARYGAPVERIEYYQVSLDTIHYWQLVTQRRSAEVVLALRRPNGDFVVHTKSFYPDGVYRLMTGGVKAGEALVAAVQREAYEETGQRVSIERFLAIVENRFQRDGQALTFISYLFLVTDQGGALASLDEDEEITDYQYVSLGELVAVADQLEALDESWIDWGRFRAAPHRLLVELLGEDNG